ncbi:MAG: polyphosphate kinase 2 family protein [Acidimicrobiia bacterium]|nr:polyphosphate kinase 2 family protein [Acidimicrobiia bacterium]
MTKLLEQLRVTPGKPVRLADRDTRDTLGLDGKDAASDLLEQLSDDLDGLHARLWAEASRSVLLVLQGMDASGKDGTIRRVLSGLNPQGCQVAAFKSPSDGELAHDYLWRVHQACPDRGHLGVFNRSHYEDVVAARLFGVVSHEQCRRRYRHLRDFERMLTDEGTTVVKVFLHLSKDEQRERLQARLDDPAKGWKFKLADLDVRKQWDDYQKAYEEALTETSTEHAPWCVVPADRKWVRDVAVSSLLVETLRNLDPKIPDPEPALRGIRVE